MSTLHISFQMSDIIPKLRSGCAPALRAWRSRVKILRLRLPQTDKRVSLVRLIGAESVIPEIRLGCFGVWGSGFRVEKWIADTSLSHDWDTFETVTDSKSAIYARIHNLKMARIMPMST